jgi:hypothetical protein
VLVAGCGSGGGNDFADQEPKDIVKAATSDMQDLKSLHMSGDVTTDGQKLGIDMKVTTSGDCQGSFTAGEGTAQVLSADGKAYMKPDDAFWEAQAPGQAAQIEAVVGDKWVVIPSGSGLDAMCDLDGLLKNFNEDDPSNEPTAATEDSLDGQDAVKLSGKDSDGNPVTAWVASDSPHYILKIMEGADPAPLSITFSDFDESLSITAPPSNQVVDLRSLGG